MDGVGVIGARRRVDAGQGLRLSLWERPDGAAVRGLDDLGKGRLKACGRMVAVLDNWQQPKYLTRIWCIFEQYTAQKLNIYVDFALPKEQGQALVKALQDPDIGIPGIGKMIRKIDCENAEASVPNDKLKVKSIIERGCA